MTSRPPVIHDLRKDTAERFRHLRNVPEKTRRDLIFTINILIESADGLGDARAELRTAVANVATAKERLAPEYIAKYQLTEEEKSVAVKDAADVYEMWFSSLQSRLMATNRRITTINRRLTRYRAKIEAFLEHD
jgi:hypothetical protein